MNDKDGWIKISKCLFKQPWYYQANRGALWVQLIGMANYTLDEDGIDRGQFKASIRQLEDETGLSTQQLRDAMTFFEQEKMISARRAGLLKDGKIYTVLKYAEYQGSNGRYTTLSNIGNKEEKPMDKGNNDDSDSDNINREQTKEQTEGQTKEQTELPVNIDSNQVVVKTEEQTSGQTKEQVISNSYRSKKESFKNKEIRKNLSLVEKREILLGKLNTIKSDEDDIALTADRFVSVYLDMLKVIGLEPSIISGLTKGDRRDWMIQAAASIISKNSLDRIWTELIEYLLDSTVPHWPELLRKNNRGWWLGKGGFSDWLKKRDPKVEIKRKEDEDKLKQREKGIADMKKFLGIVEEK